MDQLVRSWYREYHKALLKAWDKACARSQPPAAGAYNIFGPGIFDIFEFQLQKGLALFRKIRLGLDPEHQMQEVRFYFGF